jgi:hypothetical protein
MLSAGQADRSVSVRPKGWRRSGERNGHPSVTSGSMVAEERDPLLLYVHPE